ncbi:MAG TPA: chemotaxis protein CheC [Opitutaceae bacterium]|jgi:chemotaxis protein CheC
MELTSEQKDGLTELITIGYGRAASALSELTGYRIMLEVPKVSMHSIREMEPMLAEIMASPVASVNQNFSGAVSGSALFLLDEPSAVLLSRLLTEEKSVASSLDANAKEIIIEVGNILLNACLGVFGNLLQIKISFSVPRLSVQAVDRVLYNASEQSNEPLQYGLMIRTQFNVKAADVMGYLVIVLGIASLDRLLGELENWSNRQSR